MGVTIHFEGHLRDAAAYDALISMARDVASRNGWETSPIDEREVTLKRARDDEDWDYVGPVKGVEIRPHKDAEPLRLEFDENLYVQEFMKTQFAPTDIHIAVVEFLQSIEPLFASLEVYDEAEYYETGDLNELRRHFDRFFEVFHEKLAESDRYIGPFKLPSGRIADLVTKRGVADQPD